MTNSTREYEAFDASIPDFEPSEYACPFIGCDLNLYRPSCLRRQGKKIGTGIVTAMARDAYLNAATDDTFTIISGDNDCVPTVERLRADGFQVDVVFWEHAGRELREAASNLSH